NLSVWSASTLAEARRLSSPLQHHSRAQRSALLRLSCSPARHLRPPPHSSPLSVPGPFPVRENADAWDSPSAVEHDASPLNAFSLLEAVRPRRLHAKTAPS